MTRKPNRRNEKGQRRGYMIRAYKVVGMARVRCNCCYMMSTHIVEFMDLL